VKKGIKLDKKKERKNLGDKKARWDCIKAVSSPGPSVGGGSNAGSCVGKKTGGEGVYYAKPIFLIDKT